MKLKLTYIILFAFTYAAQIGLDTSINVAKNIFGEFHDSRNQDNFKIRNYDIISDEVSPLLYIYHLEPKGFIILSADDKAYPLIAYGFENDFKLDNMPSSLTSVIDTYKSQIIISRDSNEERSSDIANEWDNYLSINNPTDNSNTRNVSPLIDAEFDQSGSWNNILTSETGFNGPLGCVAISMGQIMHYWSYPEQGEGSNFYFENDLGMLEVDFGQAYYDFDNMAATYATDPSRLLLYHCGVAVNMDYENGGSGAQCQGVYPSAEYAMKTFFKYGDSIQSVDADDYDTTAEFRNILKNELDNNKPILFSGFSDSYGNGGHAWNVDGYQGNNMHCNWGWGGWSNGYYSLPYLNGFDTWQNALINLIPETYENPLALFEVEVSEMTAILIDLSEVVNEEEIESWTWDYGDGNTETNFYGFNEYTYANPGEYELSLTITNIYGQTGEPHVEYITIGNPTAPGDVNFDEVLNILDVVMIINFVLGSDTPDNMESNAADYNNDNLINVQDIVLLLNTILD